MTVLPETYAAAVVLLGEHGHNGSIGPNTTATYQDEPCLTSNGETFYVQSVVISDKTRHVAISPQEALSLLAWLQQESEALQRLVKEG